MMPSARIAGIDYGTVRIGIATADLEVGIASPYETYTRRSRSSTPSISARWPAKNGSCGLSWGCPSI